MEDGRSEKRTAQPCPNILHSHTLQLPQLQQRIVDLGHPACKVFHTFIPIPQLKILAKTHERIQPKSSPRL